MPLGVRPGPRGALGRRVWLPGTQHGTGGRSPRKALGWWRARGPAARRRRVIAARRPAGPAHLHPSQVLGVRAVGQQRDRHRPAGKRFLVPGTAVPAVRAVAVVIPPALEARVEQGKQGAVPSVQAAHVAPIRPACNTKWTSDVAQSPMKARQSLRHRSVSTQPNAATIDLRSGPHGVHARHFAWSERIPSESRQGTKSPDR